MPLWPSCERPCSYWNGKVGRISDSGDAAFVDALLDAIHAHLAGVARRPYEPPRPPHAAMGSTPVWGEHFRFGLTRGKNEERKELFDLVAGHAMRLLPQGGAISGLFLYPPRFDLDGAAAPAHVFVIAVVVDRGHADSAERVLHRIVDQILAELERAGFARWSP